MNPQFLPQPIEPLILGSSSPRRSFILSEIRVPHEQIPSEYDESLFQWSEDHKLSIQELAKAKALALVPQYKHRTILTADTIVVCEGKLLGKPKDRDQAKQYLQFLCGRYHDVLTALCVYHKGEFFCGVDLTRVKIASLQPNEIEAYTLTSIPYDKAGGYAIQGIGGLLVEKIEGCFYNVMGLPTRLAMQLLKPTGYDLWHYACSPT